MLAAWGGFAGRDGQTTPSCGQKAIMWWRPVTEIIWNNSRSLMPLEHSPTKARPRTRKRRAMSRRRMTRWMKMRATMWMKMRRTVKIKMRRMVKLKMRRMVKK